MKTLILAAHVACGLALAQETKPPMLDHARLLQDAVAKGDFARIEELDKALRPSPEAPSPGMDAARSVVGAAIAKKDWSKAMTAIAVGEKLDAKSPKPNGPEFWETRRLAVHAMKGDDSLALQKTDALLATWVGQRADLLLQIAHSLMLAEANGPLLDKAIGILKKAIPLYPADAPKIQVAETHSSLAGAWLRKGDKAAAIASLNDAVAAAPAEAKQIFLDRLSGVK
jgi:tetratricopeptide (TPR) repeat protein